MELKTKTIMEGKLESSYEMFRTKTAKKTKKKRKGLAKAIRKILEINKKAVS